MDRRSLLMGVLVLLPLAGCGGSAKVPPKYRVSGTVTLNGAPLKQGSIAFYDPDAPTAVPDHDYINNDGTYKVDAQAGHKIVRIESGKAVPAKYNESPSLGADVTPGGQNQFDFKLDSK